MRRTFGYAPVLAGLLTGGVVCSSVSAATIEFSEFSITFPGTTSFRLTMGARGTGIDVGSYGMRTYFSATKSLPGLQPRGKFQYLLVKGATGRPPHMLLDNHPEDENATKGAIAITVPTVGWPNGVHTFLCYADNRPASGAYVAARKRIRVTIENGEIVAGRSGELDMLHVRITNWEATPEEAIPGDSFDVSATVETNSPEGVRLALTSPYTVRPEDTPPGFDYVLETKHFRFPGAAQEGTFRIPTVGWSPGVYHLSLLAEATGTDGQVSDYRDLAIRIPAPKPQFVVTVEGDVRLTTGTHFGTICKLADSSVLAHGRVSRDGGRTWQKLPSKIPMGHQLRDGSIVGVGMRTKPAPGKPGWFETRAYLSRDGGKTVRSFRTNVHVPNAKAGIGHAPAPGPLFWRSIVEMPDGALLAAMYGWFVGDESPVPGQPGSMRYRTFLVESRDMGHTWAYLSTVAYDPDIGTEGYCEPVLRLLPNGELLCILRTGGDNRPFWQDNPMCQTSSRDGGKTWDKPHRMGVDGVSPDLCVMSDGTLACSYGRPGADLMLSTDNGKTWTSHTCIDPERYSGYTAVCEAEPGVLLYGYGAMRRIDEDTGLRANELRVARIRISPR
ncbi:MAG: exo-alpha-sialidase [Lentisphaerae bacterium]|jgi:hypothetical protein|nr:exo-alpha-sialidase [Lentisphaerota bacterium]MBT4814169.1 exo-alpha-sialidase [Lentisphaerota bacterium]MBT5608682.1 exo-alpha-sialidase [Lentisphaerota bacterium]MBT7841646.1 exo-alpha-sialidase [Lentisphaerota bacterium]